MKSANDPPAVAGEDELVALLAAVYRSVDWKTVGGKSVLDVWSGRIAVASRAPTMAAAVDRLCDLLGVRSLPEEAAPLLRACRANEAALLDIWADESLPLAMEAYHAVRQARGARKAEAA